MKTPLSYLIIAISVVICFSRVLAQAPGEYCTETVSAICHLGTGPSSQSAPFNPVDCGACEENDPEEVKRCWESWGFNAWCTFGFSKGKTGCSEEEPATCYWTKGERNCEGVWVQTPQEAPTTQKWSTGNDCSSL